MISTHRQAAQPSFSSVKRSSSRSPTCAQPNRMRRTKLRFCASELIQRKLTSRVVPRPTIRTTHTFDASRSCITTTTTRRMGMMGEFRRSLGFGFMVWARFLEDPKG